MEVRQLASKRKSFWQLRPTKVEAIANPDEGATCAPPGVPVGTEIHKKVSRKHKLYRILDRMKLWSKKRRTMNVVSNPQPLLKIEPPPIVESKENPYNSVSDPHIITVVGVKTPLDPRRQCASSPRPSLTLDGTADRSQTRSMNYVLPSKRIPLLHHRSFIYPQPKTRPCKDLESKSAVLKHSLSSPNLMREKLSQHFQGTVVRRPSARREPILSILSCPEIPTSPSKSSGTSVDQPTIPSHACPIPAVKPTLRTVEITAATKTYLESHFSQLLSYPSTRSSRLRKFESDLANKAISEQERRVLRAKWVKKESEYLRSLRSKRLTIGNFELVKVIGKGAFGVVKLVREKIPIEGKEEPPVESAISFTEKNKIIAPPLSGNLRIPPGHTQAPKVYALKVVPKVDILTGGQEGHIRAERDFLVASARSKWIVPLVATFQDEENLYLVMEYLIGGDFLGLLIKKTVLGEEMTRFYIAEMICCIEEAHNLGYIHRDIKPDNFVFTAEGHLKLCDFGLAFSGHRTHDGDHLDKQRHSLVKKIGLDSDRDVNNQNADQRLAALQENNVKIQEETSAEEEGPKTWVRGKRELARSIVGTNQYMAPEVVRGEPYDGRCDWWSLGIILYECLYGFTPFYYANRLETRQRILNWQKTLNFPAEPKISGPAYLLITSLLCEKQQRLTCKAYAENDSISNGPRLEGFHCSRSRPPSATYTSILNEIGGSSANRNWPNPLENNFGKNINGARLPALPMPRNHVLKNDAAEIKEHSFFKGINWKDLLRMKPPFTPEKLSGDDDTKYFDYENFEFSTTESTTAAAEPYSVNHHTKRNIAIDDRGQEILDTNIKTEEIGKENRNPFGDENKISGGTGANSVTVIGSCHVHDDSTRELDKIYMASNSEERGKEKIKSEGKNAEGNDGKIKEGNGEDQGNVAALERQKKARDRLLRDPVHGSETLELRKQVAFWGYSYRRPKAVMIDDDLFAPADDDHKLTRKEDNNNNKNSKADFGRRRVTLAGPALGFGLRPFENWPQATTNAATNYYHNQARGMNLNGVSSTETTLVTPKRRLFSQPSPSTAVGGRVVADATGCGNNVNIVNKSNNPCDRRERG